MLVSTHNLANNESISRIFRKSFFVSVLSTGLFGANTLLALPNLDKITKGDIELTSPDSNTLQINQSSDKAIMNWHDFNVAGNESVTFNQPATGICLNRIDATNGMSSINGTMSSNGTVVLINGAGIMFGKTANVNMGGLVASAVDVSNDDFTKHEITFNNYTSPGAIMNYGSINVEDLVLFFGANVGQHGDVRVKNGEHFYAVGSEGTLHTNSTKNFYKFDLEQGSNENAVDQAGNMVKNAVDITGNVTSDNGYVLLGVVAKRDIYDKLINMEGELKANFVKEDGNKGIILLAPGIDGVIDIKGKISVSDQSTFCPVMIHGDNINISASEIDVSSKNDGNAIIIGFPDVGFLDENKKTDVPSSISIGNDVTLKTNGIGTNDAGTVLIFGERTDFKGSIQARGGEISGNGGEVHIFGTGRFEAIDTNLIDVGANNGKTGNIFIS